MRGKEKISQEASFQKILLAGSEKKRRDLAETLKDVAGRVNECACEFW